MTRLALAILVLAAAPALAQTSSGPTTGTPNAVPERVEPAPNAGVPRSGVIAPPPTRPMPQADVPAERPNSTPVIPPPGTPGGDASVQPR